MATHRVGGEVDAFCTKCRMTLAHTILAMVGTKLARVRCNTCGGDHAFRAAPGARTSTPRTSAGRTRSGALKPGSAATARTVISFEDRIAGKDVSGAPKYSPKDTYQLEQIIQHPTFGLGVVSAVRGDKVDIIFKADLKTLVHGRGDGGGARPVFHPPSTARPAGPADKPLAEAPTSPAEEHTSAPDGSEDRA